MSHQLSQILLVTGASGFVGRHVANAVRDGAFGPLRMVGMPSGMDIRDACALAAFVASVKPAAVLHLAAQSFVPRSFEAPRETIDINLIGTLNLLEALRATQFRGRFIYISSGDVYGIVEESLLPVTEKILPAPRSPYAVSKVAAEQLCLQWTRTDGLGALIMRPFNHVGPGQAAHFVLPSLATQLVAIGNGDADPVLHVGDVDTTRDFTDVRDIVRAYAAALTQGRTGEIYHVASGHEQRVRTLLEVMADIVGVKPEILQDPARLRMAEQRRMVASARLLTDHTGWTREIDIQQTLNDIIEDARKRNEQ